MKSNQNPEISYRELVRLELMLWGYQEEFKCHIRSLIDQQIDLDIDLSYWDYEFLNNPDMQGTSLLTFINLPENA